MCPSPPGVWKPCCLTAAAYTVVSCGNYGVLGLVVRSIGGVSVCHEVVFVLRCCGNVYPPPTSVRDPSSARRVSDSAAMSTLYLLSSAAISADCRAGRLESSLSNKVRTFQVANRNGFRIDVHDLRPQERDAQWVRLPVRESKEQTMFGVWATFSRPLLM